MPATRAPGGVRNDGCWIARQRYAGRCRLYRDEPGPERHKARCNGNQGRHKERADKLTTGYPLNLAHWRPSAASSSSRRSTFLISASPLQFAPRCCHNNLTVDCFDPDEAVNSRAMLTGPPKCCVSRSSLCCGLDALVCQPGEKAGSITKLTPLRVVGGSWLGGDRPRPVIFPASCKTVRKTPLSVEDWRAG